MNTRRIILAIAAVASLLVLANIAANWSDFKRGVADGFNATTQNQV